ncbi:hypothetical protein ACHWQZ_G009639 [Mnemiopsis leidyi]
MASQFWRDNCGDRLSMFINMEKFCDACIQFGDGSSSFTLNCHYVVLSLHSDVFRDNIEEYPMKGSKRCISFSKYSQVEQTVIADIILSFYNGILAIDEQNFKTVYKFSISYKVSWIQEQALVEIHTFLKDTNVLSFLLLSEETRCKKLRGELIRFIVQTRLSDYRRIMSSADLHSLSPTTLKTFLKATKQLDDRPELETLEGVISWMGDSVVRLAFIKKFFDLVCWERLAGSESLVEALTTRLEEELFPKLSEEQLMYVKKCLQDAANFAACSGTMKEAMAVFSASRWTEFPLELAEFVLSNDFINATNEYVIAEAALVWLDDQERSSLQAADIISIMSTIRVDRLHGTYILKTLQPHVMKYEISPNDWIQSCSRSHVPRKNTDNTASGSVVSLTVPTDKKGKELLALKNGIYNLMAVCKCSYHCTGGPRECLTVTITVNNKASPPVSVKKSQCDFCNRMVLHVYCENGNLSKCPFLTCGSSTRIKQVLKQSGLSFYAVLSEAEDRSGGVRKSSWYNTPVRTVVRTLDNNNVSSLTEYELLEAALDWLDFRMPDKTYHEVVLSCIRLNFLHESYLKDVVIRYLKTNYFIKAELLKSLLKPREQERRGCSISPCYKKIIVCRVPLPVVELKHGDHVIYEECLCEVSSFQGEIYSGTLTVKLSVRVKQIPALTITAKCSKCNISLRHAYLSSTSRLTSFPGLATASVYRLREVFTACLQRNESSESDVSTPSEVSYSAGGTGSREIPGLIPLDKLALNLILGP